MYFASLNRVAEDMIRWKGKIISGAPTTSQGYGID